MISETQIIQQNEDNIVFGGAVTIDTLQQVFQHNHLHLFSNVHY